VKNVNDTQEAAVFDRQAFLERLGGGEELVPEFLTMFAQTVEEGLPGLEEALAAGDCETVAKIAHMIKGAAANICAERLLQVTKELEASARSGDIAGSRTASTNLAAEFRLFQKEAASWTK
jgi:HPt (histidine-containing phosphotransfer) domain-containing protein